MAYFTPSLNFASGTTAGLKQGRECETPTLSEKACNVSCPTHGQVASATPEIRAQGGSPAIVFTRQSAERWNGRLITLAPAWSTGHGKALRRSSESWSDFVWEFNE
jgi:hypothetical protein